MDDLETARQDAVRLLCAAHASDGLSLEAFDDRLDRVRQAVNRATVEAIVADLVDTGQFTGTALTRSTQVAVDHPVPFAPAESLRIASVLGSAKRAGSWTVPLALDLRVLFGELTIDLRDAVFGADFLDIVLDVKFGSLTLIVPAGTQVENEVHETLSASTHSTRSTRGAAPIGLLVRLTGQVLCSSIEIKEKNPTAFAGDQQPWWQKFLPRAQG